VPRDGSGAGRNPLRYDSSESIALRALEAAEENLLPGHEDSDDHNGSRYQHPILELNAEHTEFACEPAERGFHPAATLRLFSLAAKRARAAVWK
jgi:hypothetical protein